MARLAVYTRYYPTVWPAPRKIRLALSETRIFARPAVGYRLGAPVLEAGSPREPPLPAERRGGPAGWWYDFEGVETIPLPLSGLSILYQALDPSAIELRGALMQALRGAGLSCEPVPVDRRRIILRCGDTLIAADRSSIVVGARGWETPRVLPVPLVDRQVPVGGLVVHAGNQIGYKDTLESLASALEELPRTLAGSVGEDYVYGAEALIVRPPFTGRVPAVTSDLEPPRITVEPVPLRKLRAAAAPRRRVAMFDVTIAPGMIGVGRRERGTALLHLLLGLPEPYLNCRWDTCGIALDKLADVPAEELAAQIIEAAGGGGRRTPRPGASVYVWMHLVPVVEFTYHPARLAGQLYMVSGFSDMPYIAAPASRLVYTGGREAERVLLRVARMLGELVGEVE